MLGFSAAHFGTGSIGCIFAELLTGEVLFQGENERELCKLFSEKLGHPAKYWANYNGDPNKTNRVNAFESILDLYRDSTCCIEKYIKRSDLPEAGMDLLKKLLAYDPKTRPRASEALNHEFFRTGAATSSKEELSSFIQSHVSECHDLTYREEKRKM